MSVTRKATSEIDAFCIRREDTALRKIQKPGIFTKNLITNQLSKIPCHRLAENLDAIEMVHKLSPLPDATKKRPAARKLKCKMSEILTSSTYKIAVEQKKNEKNAKEKKIKN
ncbi:unnamed protein product [Euphydryas editha]|uniref:Uncharacterized protein n=1 Tax=Euphydryas editha TaxID=104508 RepID=A0AAU9V224_EUPED|nr:unnamed protein product [Euphydryas editha]